MNVATPVVISTNPMANQPHGLRSLTRGAWPLSSPRSPAHPGIATLHPPRQHRPRSAPRTRQQSTRRATSFDGDAGQGRPDGDRSDRERGQQGEEYAGTDRRPAGEGGRARLAGVLDNRRRRTSSPSQRAVHSPDIYLSPIAGVGVTSRKVDRDKKDGSRHSVRSHADPETQTSPGEALALGRFADCDGQTGTLWHLNRLPGQYGPVSLRHMTRTRASGHFARGGRGQPKLAPSMSPAAPARSAY